jgi:hypothetical protein
VTNSIELNPDRNGEGKEGGGERGRRGRREEGRRRRREEMEVAQTTYAYVNKCKNDKIKEGKKQNLTQRNPLYFQITLYYGRYSKSFVKFSAEIYI